MQKCQNLCTLWTAICFQSDFCVNKNDTVNISNIFCGIFKRKVTFKTINLAANWGKYLFYVLKYCNVQIYFVLCNSFTSWGKLSENFDYYTYFMITIVQGLLLELCMELSGVFQGVHFIYQLLLFSFHLFSLTLFLLLCFIFKKFQKKNLQKLN